jgi:polyisoprenoid-binding protein YceI
MNAVPALPSPAALLASLLVAAGALAPAAARADAERFVLDPEHVSVGFLVDHVGYAKTLGMFRRVTGSYDYDPDARTLSNLRIEIDATSVYTAHEKRDEHLKNRDFLDVKRHPRLVYTAATARRTGENSYAIDGQLELLGQRRPVTLTATVNKLAPYPLPLSPLNRKPVMGVSARGSFKRSDFGMDYAVENGWVGDVVELIVEIEAKQQ